MKGTIIFFINVVIAYTLFPIIYIHDYWDNIISGNYQMYDIHTTSLSDYFSLIFEGAGILGTIFLLINLLPFQLLKLKWLYKFDQNFYIKSLGFYSLFNIAFVLITGWGGLLLLMSPWFNNVPFLLVLILFSVIFQTALYIAIDRKILKKKNVL
ncbi:hypothetical protein [Sphingobacterium faecium]|uniref:hypothetical protein n=1 Tax=Sphingobacterium faecium TaxID=34087 RepID=UPI00320B1F3A